MDDIDTGEWVSDTGLKFIECHIVNNKVVFTIDINGFRIVSDAKLTNKFIPSLGQVIPQVDLPKDINCAFRHATSQMDKCTVKLSKVFVRLNTNLRLPFI